MFNVVTIYHSTLCVSSKKRNIGIIEPSLVRNITLLGVLKILLQKMYIQYTYFVYISSILIRLHFLFHFSDTHTCPIFRLGDIIDLANGSFTKISVKGGVVGVYINWNCDLDWDFEQYSSLFPNFSRVSRSSNYVLGFWFNKANKRFSFLLSLLFKLPAFLLNQIVSRTS